MNIKSIISSAALLASLAVGVHADTITANTTDLLLGFRTSTSPSNLLVDLGDFSNFNKKDGAVTNLTQLSLADIASLSASFSTSTSVLWGVIGGDSTSNTAPILLAGRAAAAPGASSSFLVNSVSGTQNSINNAGNVLFGLVDGSTSTSNSAFATLVSASDPSSWTSQENVGGTAFGTALSLAQFEQNTNTAAGTKYLDLYEADGTSGTKGQAVRVGTFALSSTGLTFTAVAIPEPSTYAIILGALTLGFVLARRRNQQVAA